MNVFIDTWKGLRGFSSDMEVNKQGEAFAENHRTGVCFEEAGFQALIGIQALVVSCEALTIHFTDQVTHKRKTCEWERNKWMTRVTEVKHKWLWGVPDEI